MFMAVNKNDIDLFQRNHTALVNVYKVIRGQWMKVTIEALIITYWQDYCSLSLFDTLIVIFEPIHRRERQHSY